MKTTMLTNDEIIGLVDEAIAHMNRGDVVRVEQIARADHYREKYTAVILEREAEAKRVREVIEAERRIAGKSKVKHAVIDSIAHNLRRYP